MSRNKIKDYLLKSPAERTVLDETTFTGDFSINQLAEGGSILKDGSVDQDAMLQAGTSLLPAVATMFDPKATKTSKGSSLGGSLGSIAGTAIGGPIGGMVGQLAGSLIGGAIGKRKEDNQNVAQYTDVMMNRYQGYHPSFNANMNGDNTSFYAEEGGQPDLESQQAVPEKARVNIEKGELMVNPESLEVVRKFTNKNRFAPHADKPHLEPVGNFVGLPSEGIIIPKKLAKTYEQGNKLTRRSILAELLKNQVNREHEEGMSNHMADGGKPKIFKDYGNTALPIELYDPSLPIGEHPMFGTMPDATVKTTRYLPGQRDSIVGGIDIHEPGLAGQGMAAPHISTIGSAEEAAATKKKPYVSPVAIAQGLNAVPTMYGLANAFGEDPFLNYNENTGFDAAESFIEQTPTDVNMEGAKMAMARNNRGMQQVLQNVNSPSVRAELANQQAQALNATGQLYATADNERKNRISAKLGQLANLRVSKGQNQEQARDRYTTALEQDAANRSGLIQKGLSEGVTNISKQIMDSERLRALNGMSKYFQLDPTGKQLVKENPDAVQHIIDQLEQGILPSFATPSGKAVSESQTIKKDARGAIKGSTTTKKTKG